MGIAVKSLKRSLGDPPMEIIKGITMAIGGGEFVAITGRSGSGKSTLLYLISSLDRPTSGTVEIDGRDMNRMDETGLHRFRNENMGFVFQSHYLLPELTALDNILMPARKTGREKELQGRAMQLMETFGLADRHDHRPAELSGGEQQRVALARALVMSPKYIFADEPTGNLDSVSGTLVMKILRSIATEGGATVVMVTHDAGYAALADRQITLADGMILHENSSMQG
jgi:ABC-type lipoprotein export system ATPase subunit